MDDKPHRDNASRKPSRRTLIAGGTALSAAALMPGGPAFAASGKPERMPIQAGDRLLVRDGPNKGKLLTADMLVTGEQGVEAFPFDPASEVERSRYRLNRIIVVRLDESEMSEDTRAMAADGVLVYSAICTHQGCTIANWVPETRHFKCFCHLSEFAALESGEVRGGPARRQLPMVPVTIDADGYVAATDGFTAKPGGAKT